MTWYQKTIKNITITATIGYVVSRCFPLHKTSTYSQMIKSTYKAQLHDSKNLPLILAVCR